MKALDSRLRRHQQGGRGRLVVAVLDISQARSRKHKTKVVLLAGLTPLGTLSRGPQGPTATEVLAPLKSVSTHPRSTDTVTKTTKVFQLKTTQNKRNQYMENHILKQILMPQF